MSALSIQPTYPIFTDIDGQPLEAGYVWIGQANLDPQVNPINVYWDAALTIAAPQPIRTLAGYPSRNGTPARLYVNSDYSIRVMNRNGSTVYSAQAATERYNDVVVSGVNAEDVIYDPPFTNAVQTNVEAKLAQTVSVKDFGADETGATSSYQAFVDALAASNYVFVPEGTFLVDQQIDITGNKTISGPDANNYVGQPAVINFTAPTGNCFSATSAEFGGITIRNLSITGGNGDYAIRSSRPQSVFENLWMEVYDGSGIQLFEAGTGSQASWATSIRNVKWVAPAAQTSYYGIDVTQNGGNLSIDRCALIRGSIGININQGQNIAITNCNVNAQTSANSSLAATSQCGIRLSGGGYKQAITIRNNYIESFTNGIYVEKCESLTIQDNYIADVGNSTNYALIYLKDTNVYNVTILDNYINGTGGTSVSVDIGDGVNNAVVNNNYIRAFGSNSICIRKGTTTYSYHANNSLVENTFTGTEISDPNYLMVATDYQTNGFFSYRRINFTSADTVWYDLGVVDARQIWQLSIADASAATRSRMDQLFIGSVVGTYHFETIFDNGGVFAVREFRLNGNMLQFRTNGAGGPTANNVSAVRVA